MQFETSSGGVIFAKNGSLLFVLLLKDKGGQWTFPKGLVEKGEERETTAQREVEEEAGIKNIRLLKKLSPIEYFYKRKGKLIKKNVYYYLFHGDINESPTPQLEEGIQEVRWFPLQEAKEIVGYKKTNKKLLEEAEFIEKLP